MVAKSGAAMYAGAAAVGAIESIVAGRGTSAPVMVAISFAAAALLIDIDYFKRVNDAHRHQAGDRVLVWLASMLCEHTRGADIVARVGGEEFVVVLGGADGPSTLEFAERLREAIEDSHVEIPLTISACVAAALAPSTAHTLLGAADRALYAAKHVAESERALLTYSAMLLVE